MPGSETLALRSHARWRVWLAVLAVFVGCGVLGGLGDWRDHHLFFVNTTDSLPNWAFLVDRGRMPAKGDYVFFAPPRTPLLRRHFGARAKPFGKIVYGVAGDVVAHRGDLVTINGKAVARMKARTRLGEPLAPGATGAIPAGCYFAATPHRDGFDSRYADIGFVCARQVLGTGVPIL